MDRAGTDFLMVVNQLGTACAKAFSSLQLVLKTILKGS